MGRSGAIGTTCGFGVLVYFARSRNIVVQSVQANKLVVYVPPFGRGTTTLEYVGQEQTGQEIDIPIASDDEVPVVQPVRVEARYWIRPSRAPRTPRARARWTVAVGGNRKFRSYSRLSRGSKTLGQLSGYRSEFSDSKAFLILCLLGGFDSRRLHHYESPRCSKLGPFFS